MERKRVPKPKILSKQNEAMQYNKAYENAKKGILPDTVLRTYRKAHPDKTTKKEMKPFEMKDAAKVMLFDKKQSKKLFKLSLYSRTEDYDPLKKSYISR